ncbi:hypothetical protein PRZ48_014610 [Zasmidium cellare]|uniref:UBL3-like ubiquitin domain-containing protein n=1 Tax=Zasmidium cellare TaxID=395010 RepID=A0ABR0DYU3_ZASCE|nr:hypothetical protein PRZ48_014610 [Zasmidium cellare]
MASQPDTVAGASAPPAAETTPSHIDTTHAKSSEQPLEMSELPASPRTVNEEEFTDAVQQQEPTPTTDAVPSTSADPPAPLERKETEALGPATEGPISTAASAGPTLNISLMLTTGVRHPYKIDEKYLRNRKAEAHNAEGQFDPREISGYKLKELIWTDWRKEWEPRPTSPSSIRLIIMGKMIEDKLFLKDFNFNIDGPNVVHMTVKPADLIDDDETAGKGTGKGGALRARDTEDRGAGCRSESRRNGLKKKNNHVSRSVGESANVTARTETAGAPREAVAAPEQQDLQEAY